MLMVRRKVWVLDTGFVEHPRILGWNLQLASVASKPNPARERPRERLGVLSCFLLPLLLFLGACLLESEVLTGNELVATLVQWYLAEHESALVDIVAAGLVEQFVVQEIS
jgi:hypothetical protein